METLKKFFSNDVVTRTLKTFVQGFVGVMVVTGGKFDKATVGAGIAAGIAAVWNYLKTL